MTIRYKKNVHKVENMKIASNRITNITQIIKMPVIPMSLCRPCMWYASMTPMVPPWHHGDWARAGKRLSCSFARLAAHFSTSKFRVQNGNQSPLAQQPQVFSCARSRGCSLAGTFSCDETVRRVSHAKKSN